MRNIFKPAIAALAMVTVVLAGTGKSIGTAGASQLLVPTGAKGVALSGSYISTVSGVDAMYYNPAGLAIMNTGVEGQFANMSWIADINMMYAAFAAQFGKGTVGLSLKSFDFGDIPVTTAQSTEPGNQFYSPEYSTATLSYARAFSDRINFGVSAKVVSESIMQTSAQGLALDMGVQYKHPTLPMSIGIALKNLGSKMTYDGPNLEQIHTPSDSETGAGDEPFRIRSQAFELPSHIDLAVNYEVIPGLGVHGAFSNQSFAFNEFRFGADYSLNVDPVELWVGGGMNMFSIDDDQTDWTDAQAAATDNIFGPSFGGGLRTAVGTINLTIEYAMRTNSIFNSTGVLSFLIGF